jgi:Domain of unknown function (DUF4214)
MSAHNTSLGVIMMSQFGRIACFGHKKPKQRLVRSTGFRPQLCALEDRLLLSTIPVNATHTLQAALQAANPAGGDVIQLEPGAAIADQSVSGGTVIAATIAGATTITVSQFISPSEVIDIGTEKGVLVDASSAAGVNFQLTLHASLAIGHAIGEAVTPEPNVIGIGSPVTLQGDPADPLFTFPNPFVVKLFKAANTSPVVLQHLALSGSSGTSGTLSGHGVRPGDGTGAAGDLTLNDDLFTLGGPFGESVIDPDVGGSLTINGCVITDSQPNSDGVTCGIAENETITNTVIACLGGGDGNSSNVGGNLTISGSNITVGGGDGESSGVTGTITITNTDITMTGSDNGNFGIADGGNGAFTKSGNVLIRGVTVTIAGPATGSTGAGGIGLAAANVTVADSSIRFINETGQGLTASIAAGGTETVIDDVFDTGGKGTALVLTGGAGLKALVQGNDFRGNLVGVQITGDGTSGGNVDLGGGSLGSQGGNDFRNYPAGGAGGSFAISLASSVAGYTASARQNIWSLDASGNVIDPHPLIQDGSHNAGVQGTGVLDLGTSQLSANQEFLQTVYRTFLGRVGNVAQEIDAFWVPLLPTLGLNGVVTAIVHQAGHEAYRHLVDGFYEEFLNRTPDAGGESAWVTDLAAGATAEQVLAGFVTAPEFALRNPFLTTSNNSDSGFVQALYNRLFNRTLAEMTLAAADINAGVSLVTTQGRGNLVTGVLAGTDLQTAGGSSFRQAAVRSFYGDPTLDPLPFLAVLPDLLHRAVAPGAGEISFWVGSSVDLLGIAVSFADTPEFFAEA